MIRELFLLALLLMGLTSIGVAATEDCLNCHGEESASRQLQRSAHAGKLGCSACHGTDHDAIIRGESRVEADVCGKCHPQEYVEHKRSRHGMGLRAGWGCTRNESQRDQQECDFCHQQGDALPISTVQCARFIKQSGEMRQLGCNRCHQIEKNCSSCHTNHLTDASIVRDPQVCAKCHMGPDHPQWEVWKTSQHGTLYATLGSDDAPTCQYCHMSGKTHDVTGGLTAPPSGKPYAKKKATAQRKLMLSICANCHAAGFATKELARADAVREQTLALVEEARRIIRDLDDRDLLDPQPQSRVAHPQRGSELVLDGDMLYEDISYIESLFFRLNKYAAAKTFKGAYHQNPAYTHWYGNAEVKLLLNDIRGEARRLREPGRQEQVMSAVPSDEKDFEVLRERHKRGELSDAEYAEKKRRILEQILQ